MKRKQIRRAKFVPIWPVLGVLAAAWLGGFIWFAQNSLRAPDVPNILPPADGIVVLTGGADRIVTGVHLLQQGNGHVLLISGVGHGADLADLLRGSGIAAEPLAARVTLGRSATKTIGNADETADWAERENLHALIVVTASYHMRRALTELHRSMPEMVLIAYPVVPPALRQGGSLAVLRLLAGEYSKWLAAEAGLSRLEADPGRESE